MARDNSPKIRQKRQLERKRANLASHDRILIVSEGSKTEPNYFNEIRSFYRLSTANIEVRRSELGTAPIQVVEYAQSLFEQGDSHKKIQPRAFEQVFLKQHSEQKQKQTSLVSRLFFAAVFAHLCRQVLKHFARQVMIQETLTLSVSTR